MYSTYLRNLHHKNVQWSGIVTLHFLYTVDLLHASLVIYFFFANPGTLSKVRQLCHCSRRTSAMLLATLVILSLPHIIPLLFGRVTIDLKLPPSGTKSLLPNLKYLTPLTTAMQNGSRGSHLGDGQLKLISLSLLTSEPLIGREKEKQIISNWLEFQESPVQIVSIVGGPGVGKSAVALEVGHTLVQQGIAVHYVDMHNVSSRVHPLQISKPLEDWAKHVKDSTLLILDNCDSGST